MIWSRAECLERRVPCVALLYTCNSIEQYMKSYLPVMIVFTAEDIFGTFLLSLSMPYDRKHSLNGKYSKQFKILKEGAAYCMDKKQIRVKFEKDVSNIKDRVVLKMASGIILDMPQDMNQQDWSIIKAQFDVLKIRFK